MNIGIRLPFFELENRRDAGLTMAAVVLPCCND